MALTEQAIREGSLSLDQRITLDRYKRAEAELRTEEGRIGFFAHVIVYVLINVLLIVFNLVFVPAVIWFFYPLLTWGIGLSMHYIYGVRWMHNTIEDWESKVEYRVKQNLLQEGDAT